jgi:Copine
MLLLGLCKTRALLLLRFILTLVAVQLQHAHNFALVVAVIIIYMMFHILHHIGSNGDPSSDSSLHYLDPSHRVLNQYQQAILNIGSILEEYDSDKRFPVYGKYILLTDCASYTHQ